MPAALRRPDQGLPRPDQRPAAPVPTVRAAMDKPNPRRFPLGGPFKEGSDDPAAQALVQLIESERMLARLEESELVRRQDPGQVWLLWFAIGATDEICRYSQRRDQLQRNNVFREVVGLIFGQGVQSAVNPIDVSSQLIDLFESAGAEAVRACMRGDRKLGYYLEALKVASRTAS